MKQELTPQQIDELFAFCRRHYVHYYDVQLELVDHLANAIEEKMNADKNISFEAALNAVYNSFGYKGFAGVVEAKQTSISKHWKKLRWQFFKAYFTWPKAALTLMLFAIVIMIRNIFSDDNQKYFLIIYPLIFLAYETSITIFFYRRNKKIKQKLLLTQVLYFLPAISTMYFNLEINIYQIKFIDFFSQPNYFNSLMYYQSTVTFIILLLFSFSHKSTTEKILQEAQIQYPQAFAS